MARAYSEVTLSLLQCLTVTLAAKDVFGLLQSSATAVDATVQDAVYSQCFNGLGLSTCKVKQGKDMGYLLSQVEVCQF